MVYLTELYEILHYCLFCVLRRIQHCLGCIAVTGHWSMFFPGVSCANGGPFG